EIYDGRVALPTPTGWKIWEGKTWKQTELWDGLVTSQETDDFMKAGNQYLFPFNMKNLSYLIKGKDIPGMEGLRGKDLDYELVKFEQKKVQEFTTNYKKLHPDVNFDDVAKQINRSFNSHWISWIAPDDVNNVIDKKFKVQGTDFNFLDYDDRVTLGKGLVDILHERNGN
ncbi:MAG: hypothetical protein O4808_17990, partial [Trichodesmium sp. St17_bin3_1_1]|nr:hypothetical protein [Trichodesmium sp. St17_bin3_1_1]